MERFKGLAAVALGLGMLGLAMRNTRLDDVAASLGAVHGGWLLVALVLDAGVFAVKALKWQFVCRPIARLPLGRFFSGIAVGALANTALPLRLDEAVRSFYFGARSGLSKVTVLGTILVERLIDATMLAFVLGSLFVAFGGLSWLPGLGAGLLVLALVSLVSGVAALIAGRDRLPGASGRASAREPGWLARLGVGLAVLGPGRVLVLFGCATGEWLLATLHVAAALRAFGIRLTATGNLVVVAASYLGFALPGAPGGLGMYEMLVKTSLARGFDLDPSQALGAALTLHALLVVPISLAGALILARDGLSLKRLRSLAASTPAGGVEARSPRAG